MDSCIDMASTYGIGMCSIKQSNHFGMSASFVLQAARRGMMSLVFTNSSPAVSPTRTRAKANFSFSGYSFRAWCEDALLELRGLISLRGDVFLPLRSYPSGEGCQS
jgi:hypothetical protein